MKAVKLLLASVCLLLLTGCWSYRELNESVIVAGAAVDLNGDGSIRLTTELVDFSDSQQDSGSAKRIVTHGETLADAVDSIITATGRTPYWQHAVTLVVSEEYAKRGLYPLLDYIAKTKNMRLTMNVVVARMDSADQALGMDAQGSPMRSFAIRGILRETDNRDNTLRNDAYTLIHLLGEPWVSPVVSTVIAGEGAEGPMLDVKGFAVLDKDRLIGYLDETTSQDFMLACNSLQGATYNLDQQGVSVNVFLSNWNNHITPEIQGDRVTLHMEIEAEYELRLTGTDLDFSEPEKQKQLEAALAQAVDARLQQVVTLFQTEYGVDAMGFATLVRRQEPDFFRSVSDRWDEIFRQITVTTSCSFRRAGSFAQINPLKVR